MNLPPHSSQQQRPWPSSRGAHAKLPPRTPHCYPILHASSKTQGAPLQNFGGQLPPCPPSSAATDRQGTSGRCCPLLDLPLMQWHRAGAGVFRPICTTLLIFVNLFIYPNHQRRYPPCAIPYHCWSRHPESSIHQVPGDTCFFPENMYNHGVHCLENAYKSSDIHFIHCVVPQSAVQQPAVPQAAFAKYNSTNPHLISFYSFQTKLRRHI